MSEKEEEELLHINIKKQKKGFETPQEIVKSLKKGGYNDEQIITLLSEASVRINELMNDLATDRRAKMAAYRGDANEAEERVHSYDKALITIGGSINTLLSELPSVTVRREIRNDIKNQIDDEKIFDQLGIKSSTKKPSNSNFLFSSPTVGSILLNDEQYEVAQSNHSGIKLWTFSAASTGAVSNSQDAISYSFNSWGKKADIPLGIISIADGVSNSKLSGHWARLIAYYSANVQPYPEEKKQRQLWMHTLSKFMITNYRRGGAFHNYLNRRNCEIIVKQENEPLNKILNSASTLLQLRFEGRDRINWDSVGDSYLFHWDGDNVNSLINVEKSNQPNTISFRGTYFRPECDTCKISKGDKIIITTDQMGEFLSDGIDAIPIVVSKLTESPNIKSMKKKWIDICNEVWANNDSIVNDDLTMVIVSFEPENEIDKTYISNYLDRGEKIRNDDVMKFLDEVGEDETFTITTSKSERVVSLNSFISGRFIQGAAARYYRLSDGLGLKIYSRHDLDMIGNSFTNQFLLKESYTVDEPNGITSKWIDGLDLPAFEFVEKIDGKEVNAIVMEHIEGSRLQKYFLEQEEGDYENEVKLYKKIIFNLFHSINKLHNFGISHGDLCASNIIVREDGTVCLVDLDSIYSNNLLEGKERGKPGYNPFYQWDGNVDVVPYLVISLSLKLLGYSRLYQEANEGEESLIFSTEDIKMLQRHTPEKINEQYNTKISKLCDYMIADALGEEDIADEIKNILKSLRNNYLTRDWATIEEPEVPLEYSDEEE